VDYAPGDGRAARFLADLSRRARLVVLGSRGSNGFTGLLLGSISQELIRTADCPVLIARAHHDR
jgi:nucleotide-binding universal stress UspA family protein